MMPLVSDKSIAPSLENKPAEQPKKLKACCACPDTKRARDAW